MFKSNDDSQTWIIISTHIVHLRFLIGNLRTYARSGHFSRDEKYTRQNFTVTTLLRRKRFRAVFQMYLVRNCWHFYSPQHKSCKDNGQKWKLLYGLGRVMGHSRCVDAYINIDDRYEKSKDSSSGYNELRLRHPRWSGEYLGLNLSSIHSIQKWRHILHCNYFSWIFCQ